MPKKAATKTKETDTKEPPKVAKKPVAKKASGLKVPTTFGYGTGRRKSAIAKVWVFSGKGNVEINRSPMTDYLKREVLVRRVVAPLQKLQIANKYDIKISVLGGGLTGQADACQHGVSRALLSINPEFRKPLKEDGFLTRDARVKERKKYGRKRARKGFQFRKR